MKKLFSIIALIVTYATSCIGQNLDVKRLSVYDLNKVKSFFKDNLTSLDPIEGIYSVSLNRNKYFDDESFQKTFSYKCIIIRYGDGFFLKKITDDGNELVYNADIHRIGELNMYNIKLEYDSGLNTDNSRKIASSRIEMSSLLRFHFKTSMNYYLQDGLLNFNYVYNDDFDFIKEYPTPSMYEEATTQIEENKPRLWTGTGYSIGNGYLVTNYHVAGEAKTILIKGVKGDMNTGLTAEVVATDKVIGYPLTQALGNEIKLTNGIISSRTGYQGNISTYQISAPVQPGNSGGPMFDSKGNIIGIVVAGVPGAENVGYAIKTSYLKILIESAGLNIKFPTSNTIATLSLTEKVKRIKNFVFYIECSNE